MVPGSGTLPPAWVTETSSRKPGNESPTVDPQETEKAPRLDTFAANQKSIR